MGTLLAPKLYVRSNGRVRLPGDPFRWLFALLLYLVDLGRARRHAWLLPASPLVARGLRE